MFQCLFKFPSRAKSSLIKEKCKNEAGGERVECGLSLKNQKHRVVLDTAGELKGESLQTRKPMKMEIRTLPYVSPSTMLLSIALATCISLAGKFFLSSFPYPLSLLLFLSLSCVQAWQRGQHRVNLPRVRHRDSHQSLTYPRDAISSPIYNVDIPKENSTDDPQILTSCAGTTYHARRESFVQVAIFTQL